MCGWCSISGLNQRANSRRRRVKNRHFMILNHLPKAAGIRVSRDAFKDDLRDAHRQWSVGYISVTGNPAYVSRTPEYVIILNVECPAHSVHGMQQIAS